MSIYTSSHRQTLLHYMQHIFFVLILLRKQLASGYKKSQEQLKCGDYFCRPLCNIVEKLRREREKIQTVQCNRMTYKYCAMRCKKRIIEQGKNKKVTVSRKKKGKRFFFLIKTMQVDTDAHATIVIRRKVFRIKTH